MAKSRRDKEDVRQIGPDAPCMDGVGSTQVLCLGTVRSMSGHGSGR